MRFSTCWPALFLLALTSSCWTSADTDPGVGPTFTGEGYRPVYLTTEELRTISTTAPAKLKSPGKIYVRGNFLFINERYRGIHVIDNADPRQPVNLSFISIPGNVDIAVKGSVLYADNGVDFVALDISDPQNVRVLKRIENAFPQQNFPLVSNVYFECPDAKKGSVLVRWEKVRMSKPRCYR